MNSRNFWVSTLVTVVLAGTLIVGFLAPKFFDSGDSATPLTLLSNTVNPYAKISAEGYPLPSDAKEDVVISVVDTSSGSSFSSGRILYDYDTSEWEIAITDELGLINMAYADNSYYVFDSDNNNWFEVGAAEASGVFDLDTVYFDESVVEGFLSQTSYLNQVECGSGLCSAWQVILSTEEDEDEIVDTLTIRVENGSRKIYDITAIGQGSNFTITYSYQDVDIEAPTPIAEDPNIQIINLEDELELE